jgi:hypothetical protein
VTDRDSDGTFEYFRAVRIIRKMVDANGNGNAEYNFASATLLELWDRDDDGDWDAGHLRSKGYIIIDRDDDGIPEKAERWDIDKWWRTVEDTPDEVSSLIVLEPPVDPEPLEAVSL